MGHDRRNRRWRIAQSYSVTAKEGLTRVKGRGRAELFVRLEGLDDEQHRAGRAPIGRAGAICFGMRHGRAARLGDERLTKSPDLDEAAQK